MILDSDKAMIDPIKINIRKINHIVRDKIFQKLRIKSLNSISVTFHKSQIMFIYDFGFVIRHKISLFGEFE